MVAVTGRASRAKGHRAELAVAAYLRQRGYTDAATTRGRLGHDGTHTPGDVVAIPGLVIEVKDVGSSAWPSWCRQAEDEADGRPWVVIRKLRGSTDVGAWPCLDSATRDDVRRHAGTRPKPYPFAEFLAWWENDTEMEMT